MGTEEEPGIVPRFIKDLFGLTEDLCESTFSIQCSFFEIYNENIIDLLNVNDVINKPGKSNLNLREDPKRGVFVDGLTQEIVSTFNDALQVFARGETLRTTAETAYNERSSRSHGIFSLIVEHDYMPEVL